MSWLDKLLGKNKPVGQRAPREVQVAGAAQEHASEEQPAQAARMPKAIALSNDKKGKIDELVEKATACWGSTSPSVTATWLSRTAVILAEAGDQLKATELLERAQSVLRDERDPISAGGTLSEVAASLAKAGSALGNPQLLERALGLIKEIPDTGFRAVALANILAYASETGDSSLRASVKKRLTSQMDFLTGFQYSLAAREAVKILAKSSAAKDEIVQLLETGLTRGKSDELFGETAVRDMGIAYAEAARDLAEKSLIERALDIAKQLDGAADRATVYEDVALAYASLGLQDEAKQYLAKQKNETKSIEDSWDRKHAEMQNIVAAVLVGVLSSDGALVQEGLKAADNVEDRELALISIVESLVDIAKTRNDPSIVGKAGEVADRLEEPFGRDCRLADRVGVLCRSDRSEEAGALIAQASSDLEAISDSISRGSAYLEIAEAILQTASLK